MKPFFKTKAFLHVFSKGNFKKTWCMKNIPSLETVLVEGDEGNYSKCVRESSGNTIDRNTVVRNIIKID